MKLTLSSESVKAKMAAKLLSRQVSGHQFINFSELNSQKDWTLIEKNWED